jgi:hypothetical protein
MKTLSLCLLLLAAVISQAAETILTTNLVLAAPSFREVDGKLYNIDKSVLWKNFDRHECLTVHTNGIVVEEVTFKRIYAPPASVDRLQSTGNFLGSARNALPPARRLISEERIPGKKYFLRNYPLKRPAIGDKTSIKALYVGTVDYGSETLEMWDCGTPHWVSVVKTNSPVK